MDLLFSKYANPFVLLDEMIILNRLFEFVTELIRMDNEKKLWELYLSCVSNPFGKVGSFEEFKNKCSVRPTTDSTNLEATVKNSVDLLKEFNPHMKEG